MAQAHQRDTFLNTVRISEALVDLLDAKFNLGVSIVNAANSRIAQVLAAYDHTGTNQDYTEALRVRAADAFRDVCKAFVAQGDLDELVGAYRKGLETGLIS